VAADGVASVRYSFKKDSTESRNGDHSIAEVTRHHKLGDTVLACYRYFRDVDNIGDNHHLSPEKRTAILDRTYANLR
jgi:hypothetical protein